MLTRRRGAVALAAVVLLAGCTAEGRSVTNRSTEGTEIPSTSGTSSVKAPPSSTVAVSALPGTEALAPAPADPAAAEHLRLLAGLTGTSLRGHLNLTVSGLVGFNENVTGTCTTSPAGSTFVARLADGSTDTTTFDGTGGSSVLRAPDGTTSANTLTKVVMAVQSGKLTLSGAMVTAGTTEPSGKLALTASCA